MPEASKTGLLISQQRDVTVVGFRSASILDASAVEAVAAELGALVDQRHLRWIVLDFSQVRFLASQMIGAVVGLHKKADEAGGRVVLCGLTPNLFRVFEVSRLDGVLSFAPGLAEAVAMLSAAEPPPPAPSPPAAVAAGPRWKGAVNRQIRIFFAGALVVVPVAITVWVIWSIGTWLDGLGYRALSNLGVPVGDQPPPGPGALIVLGATYVLGLLTHLYVFRLLLGLLERLVARVPGVKTIYESVRDLMQLFGGDSRRMGRVVQYNIPNTGMSVMGILTNDNPLGLRGDTARRKVAVFLPFSYMLGGPTVLVSPEHIIEVDMTVEQCLKLCATAQVSSTAPPAKPPPPPPDGA